MNKCPKCGLYMVGHMEYIFGGARMVWMCPCGYSTKQSDTGMSYSNKTEKRDNEIGYVKRIQRQI